MRRWRFRQRLECWTGSGYSTDPINRRSVFYRAYTVNKLANHDGGNLPSMAVGIQQIIFKTTTESLKRVNMVVKILSACGDGGGGGPGDGHDAAPWTCRTYRGPWSQLREQVQNRQRPPCWYTLNITPRTDMYEVDAHKFLCLGVIDMLAPLLLVVNMRFLGLQSGQYVS